MQENHFEMYPGGRFEKSGERDLADGEGDFEKAMQSGVPEFAGEQFGVANEKMIITERVLAPVRMEKNLIRRLRMRQALLIMEWTQLLESWG